MTEHDDIIERLQRLQPEPVPPATASAHLTAMGLARTVRPLRHVRRAAIASTALVGSILGSTGLAAAGALPGPMQGVAHDVLSRVSLEVPDRPGRSDADTAVTDRERSEAVDATRTGCEETSDEPRVATPPADLDGRTNDTEPRPNPDAADAPTDEELAARLEMQAGFDCTDDGVEREGTDTEPREGTVTEPREGTDSGSREGTDTEPREGTDSGSREGSDGGVERDGTDDTSREGTDAAPADR